MKERMMTFNTIATESREEERDGRKYIVVPVVAVKEGVMNGEYLSAEELLSVSLDQWSDIPVPVGHPTENGENVSSRTRDIIDEEVIGRLYNPIYAGATLKGELWIDIEKALELGGDAEVALNKLQNGEPLEVSTGYLLDLEVVEGSFNGEEYVGIQHNLRPDHIAVLPNAIGACSWADGCGAGRVNEKGVGMRINLREGESVRQREDAVLEAIRAVRSEDEESVWISDLYEDSVVFNVFENGAESYFQVSYQITDTGITLGDATEVDRTVTYVVANEEIPVKTPCEEQAVSVWSRFKTGLMRVLREVDGMSREEMIQALSERGVADDLVANTTDDQLAWMMEHSEPAVLVPVEPVEPVPGEPVPVEPVELAPGEPVALNENTPIGNTGVTFGEVAAYVANSKIELAQSRQGMLDALAANEACTMTPEVLATMSVDALTQLSAHFTPVSFLGAGVPRTNAADAIPAPPSVLLKAAS